MPSLADLKIQIWADGADFAQMVGLNTHPLIKGFTTNPSLLRKSGVTDYEKFIRDCVAAIPDKPISFEVLADDLKEMERQARKLASFGKNVYVKIPVMTTDERHTYPLLRRLSRDHIPLNVTAVMTEGQILSISEALMGRAPAIVSVFAGRIADTGEHAAYTAAAAVRAFVPMHVLTLWASTREVWNIFQAESCGCDIITVGMDLIKKFDLIGKDLTEYSRETVQQFYDDGQKAGLLL